MATIRSQEEVKCVSTTGDQYVQNSSFLIVIEIKNKYCNEEITIVCILFFCFSVRAIKICASLELNGAALNYQVIADIDVTTLAVCNFTHSSYAQINLFC